MTKNQILNTKCQPNFLISIPKDKWTVQLSLLFWNLNDNTNFGWNLVFSIWLLVNQMKNKCNKIILIQLNKNILSIFLKKKNA